MPDSAGKLQGALAAEQLIPHGVFNPLAINKNPKKQLHDVTAFDPFISLKEELTKKYTPDVFDLKTEWNAIVLRTLDTAETFLPIINILAGILSEPEQAAKVDMVRFYGRIPEIHGCLLTPSSPDDILAISMYPIFEGASSLGQPQVGDIVRVTFDNLNDFSGPKYIGPLTAPGSIGGMGTGDEGTSPSNASPQQAFVNGPRSRRTSVPQVSDLNTDPNRVGHPVTSGFPKNLIRLNMEKGKFPHALYDRARARGFNTDLVPVPDITIEQHLNIYLSVACAEVIEQYWRQQYPDATVMIISNVRNRSERDRSNSHGLGAAIDFTVHANGTTIPVLQTWAALTRLGAAGRIPMGGRGMYLNTSANGIKGIKPEECGEASPGQGQPRSNLPQGGSAGVHYDWRDTFGNQRGPAGGKPNTWVSTDTNGDGHDEYELGESNSTLGTDANYVLTYLRNNFPTIKAYFHQAGRYDRTLPEVGPKVFNILQVLELEQ